MKTLGIYVHIPFCKQKCYYCDFVSFANLEHATKKYVECLKKEILNCKSVENYNVTTIYFGGGTPSYLDANEIIEILDVIKQKFTGTFEEITIEINPGTVNQEKLEIYKKSGINRISIGMQETDNLLLKQIGRIHTYEEFEEAYKLARKVGFKNINIDLMIGLPNQNIENIKNSIKKIENLNPEHISMYSLILEEGTILEKQIKENKLKLPSEELERNMYWYLKDNLEILGYKHYEISNFAKPKYQSKHNLNCWNQEEYLGFGVAAHSYIDKTRFSNNENLEEYVNNIENIQKYRTINEIQEKLDTEKEYMLLRFKKNRRNKNK